MDEAIFFTLTDIDECRINSWQHVFNGAEVNVADLVATLGNDQLINPFIREHRGDPQLLGDDYLLGHGNSWGTPARTQFRSTDTKPEDRVKKIEAGAVEEVGAKTPVIGARLQHFRR